jgi:gamma-D-glutamyl-L-lysine dipeptidyl-peptidase
MKSVERAIDDVRKDFALDRRSSVFEVHVVARDGVVTLLGHATEEEAMTALIQRVQALRGVRSVEDDVVRLPAQQAEHAQHALVRAALAPVYLEPRIPSPQITQIVLGSRVDLLSQEGVWWRIRGEDAYIGWVHNGYLAFGPAEWARAWERGEIGEPVVSLGAELLDDEGRVLMRLPWAARLLRFSQESYAIVDGTRGQVGSGEIVPVDRLFDRFPPRGDSVTRTARRWLGSSYLWGGVTMAGVDCSGLTQAVLWMHGVALPRDSDLQARVGNDVDTAGRFDDFAAGDLLFFAETPERISHVAISLGGSSIIHSSLTNGEVAVNDLNGEKPFEARLREMFRHARRLLPD